MSDTITRPKTKLFVRYTVKYFDLKYYLDVEFQLKADLFCFVLENKKITINREILRSNPGCR